MSEVLVPIERGPAPNPALEQHRISTLPILVLLPHSRCNCHCIMCDIWRIREIREITPDDLEKHLDSFRTLRVRWLVLSGGEPQLHSDFTRLCLMLRAEGIRVTLLTAGLLLERHAESVARSVDDVIVSLDGPAEIHDQIRGVRGAFERLRRGVNVLLCLKPELSIKARSTVQKVNSRHLRATVRSAKELGLDSISFLAADITSTAFNRRAGWTDDRRSAVVLTAEGVDLLEEEMEALIADFPREISSGFITENESKLRDIVQHFRAYLGQVAPRSPQCNAPWVSAVIESDGAVRPCFFHAAYGNLHEKPLPEILNSEGATAFRRDLDIATNPVCKRCVCSLNLPRGEGLKPQVSI